MQDISRVLMCNRNCAIGGLRKGYVHEDTPALVAGLRLLLQDLSGVRMNLLVLDLARIPATAEGFDEINRAH